MKQFGFFVLMLAGLSLFSFVTISSCGGDVKSDPASDTDVLADKDTVPDVDATPENCCGTEYEVCGVKDTKQCIEIDDTKYVFGLANCMVNCCGWNTERDESKNTGCREREDVEPYGTASINANFPFIFDSSKFNDQQYQQAHMDGLMMDAAFTGEFGAGKPLPPAGGQYTIAFALHMNGSKPKVQVIQQTLQGQATLAPGVVMQFPSDMIEVTDYDLDLFVNYKNPTMLMLTGQNNCSLAIALGGVVTVTKATNTSAADGGTLAFNASEILLYYPTETPGGDISKDIGGTVCPKE